ncbi:MULTISPECIES: MarR family winged helix-turn-helix transcriptional regulator [unclassified Clostridioides]|uniref:MarR family winged helix-turn-helix transcriptional regulator n=1 Tax=unclassified Clostridioides TaxID=2635829 RepID=UPI001D0FED0B|nr:MarR family transcriptional regulator [Clostridioides sp. ES-S-0171-01]MCC0688862.1 MarR family transcriptional regulator [Clostridioides sp. ES-S-0056-01]UDN53515.1 MarR family transcriptional regulator [Clostridioides sp. ES-S-0054-01]
MDNLSIDHLCELFLQVINQYSVLEKRMHTYEIEPQIYLAEIHTIAAIGTHENINVTDLAKLQGTSKSAVSQAISKLVKKGFIEKRVSPNTENEVILFLTEKGKQVFDMHEKQHTLLRAELINILEKYPSETLNILSSLAVDVQKMWKEILM